MAAVGLLTASMCVRAMNTNAGCQGTLIAGQNHTIGVIELVKRIQGCTSLVAIPTGDAGLAAATWLRLGLLRCRTEPRRPEPQHRRLAFAGLRRREGTAERGCGELRTFISAATARGVLARPNIRTTVRKPLVQGTGEDSWQTSLVRVLT